MNPPTDIETKVIDLIRHELHARTLSLDSRTRLDHLSADSLAVLKLTLAFEETFDIEIPDEDADRIRTVEDAVVTVERCVRARGPWVDRRTTSPREVGGDPEVAARARGASELDPGHPSKRP
jgi:acyl carrier protein